VSVRTFKLGCTSFQHVYSRSNLCDDLIGVYSRIWWSHYRCLSSRAAPPYNGVNSWSYGDCLPAQVWARTPPPGYRGGTLHTWTISYSYSINTITSACPPVILPGLEEEELYLDLEDLCSCVYRWHYLYMYFNFKSICSIYSVI
jgi:hypothetical protein